MTFDDFTAILKSVGVPMAYNDFDGGEFTPDATPYIAYLITGSNSFYADGVAYYTTTAYMATLYEDKVLSDTEKTLENAFTANDVTFAKAYEWQEEEKYYKITYTMEV
jgi:hypothetical protein